MISYDFMASFLATLLWIRLSQWNNNNVPDLFHFRKKEKKLTCVKVVNYMLRSFANCQRDQKFSFKSCAVQEASQLDSKNVYKLLQNLGTAI